MIVLECASRFSPLFSLPSAPVSQSSVSRGDGKMAFRLSYSLHAYTIILCYYCYARAMREDKVTPGHHPLYFILWGVYNINSGRWGGREWKKNRLREIERENKEAMFIILYYCKAYIHPPKPSPTCTIKKTAGCVYVCVNSIISLFLYIYIIYTATTWGRAYVTSTPFAGITRVTGIIIMEERSAKRPPSF